MNGYTDAAGAVQLGRLGRDSAPGSHVHYLAALKHAGEIDSPRDGWPQLVCNSTGYIEAIFVGEVGVSSIAEIRVAADDYRALWELCFQSHGRAVSDGDRARAHAFLLLLRARRDNRIRLCEVPDA